MHPTSPCNGRRRPVTAPLFTVLAAALTVAANPLNAQPSATFAPAPSPAAAGFSPDRLARIDSLVMTAVNSGQINGAVVHIVRHGQVVLHRAYGVRDVGTRAPMQPNDIFRIASQSKAITALAVMMLWEEGRFGLDDPVSRYIPEFRRPRVLTAFNAADSSYTAEPAGREITIRQLLTHTSGLDYAGIGSEEFRALYAKAGVPSGIGNDASTIGEKMRILGQLPLRSRPGERYIYSLSYDVLGYLVEVVSGMPFDRFLRERVFEPLGMRDTWFYLPADRQSRLVTLHDGESGRAVAMRGEVFDGVRLLSPRTVEMMLTDQLPAMGNEVGLGFGLETGDNDFRSPRSIGAFSWGGAFQTTYWADPRDGLVAQLYTNMVNSPAGALGGTFNTLVYAAIVR